MSSSSEDNKEHQSRSEINKRRSLMAVIENPNQAHWLGHFLFATIGLSIAISYLRVYPEAVHSFCRDHLNPWQTRLLVITISTCVMAFAFRLFSPRVGHLGWPLIHPPIWLAWLISIVVLCVADLATFGDNGWRLLEGYESTAYDWGLYFLLPLLLVAVWHWLLRTDEDGEIFTIPESTPLASAGWERVEEWLRAEGCPVNDGLSHLAFAEKLADRLLQESRSIGLVGGFGSGKSTIISWMQAIIEARITKVESSKREQVFWVRQSCWGFESSSLAIQQILRAGIAEVEKKFDTFYIRSIPESYRQTFAAGGDWLSAIVELAMGRKDSFEQFERLSKLLEQTNSRLILIVEDLDRNETSTFSIDDVCAFLYRLRQHPRLQFVLAADTRSARKIDFRKLTDHTEHVPMVGVTDLYNLLTRVHREDMRNLHPSRRQDTKEQLVEFSSPATHELDKFPSQPIARAVIELVRTPRTLRLALRRTHYVWSEQLSGEVNWVELFLVNVLRVAAPEAFSFLFEFRNRFALNRDDSKSRAGRDHLLEQWKARVAGCDWSPEAAEVVIVHLFPEAGLVFYGDKGASYRRLQSVKTDRYWTRVCNERIPQSEVADRKVLEDIERWKLDQSPDSRLVTQLVVSADYAQTFECVHETLLGNDFRDLLELFSQVIEKTVESAGNETTWASNGYNSLAIIVSRYLPPDAELIDWICDRIRAISACSMGMVYALNRLWTNSNSVINPTTSLELRRRTSEILCEGVKDFRQLSSMIGSHDWVRSALSDLVFEDANEVGDTRIALLQDSLLYGVDWRWLGPILLHGLIDGDAKATTIAVSLCSKRNGRSQTNPVRLDTRLLAYFFNGNASRVLELLRAHADNPNVLSQLDNYDQSALRQSVSNLG
jgi:hypothetical protein